MGNLWERAVVLALLPFIKPDSVVIDCGANIGGVSQALQSKLDKHGLIISIEPNRKLQSQIQKNLRQGVSKSLVIMKAAWDHSGQQLELHVDDSHYSTGSSIVWKHIGRNVEMVETIALDDITEANSDRLSVIKIDTEGSEHRVLLGANKIIANKSPVICMEVTPQDRSAISLLRERNYDFFYVNSLERVEFEDFFRETGLYNLLCIPPNIQLDTKELPVTIKRPSRTFEIPPGRYVCRVTLDDVPNCLNGIGIKNIHTNQWEIFYEIEMNHLKHFTNSTLPFLVEEQGWYEVSLIRNCGHDHITSFSLAAIELNIDGEAKTGSSFRNSRDESMTFFHFFKLINRVIRVLHRGL